MNIPKYGMPYKMLQGVTNLQGLQTAEVGVLCAAGYLSPLGFVVEKGADVSKAEHNSPGNGLAGIPAAEEAIWITHDPAQTHNNAVVSSMS